MKRINKTVLCLFLLLLSSFLFYQQAVAQCNNVSLSLTKTNSTCLSNGTITVSVTGPDAANIDQSSMQFAVSGDKDLAFAHYTDNKIENLPAGTYTISLKAFCQTNNDWFIATSTATTSITSTYRELNFEFSRVIPTLNCKNTGIALLAIESGTGSPPFNVEITSWPSGYTGPTTFSINSRTDSIKNLAAGGYTFKVSDNCGYTVANRNITVGTMSLEYYEAFYPYFFSAGTTANACDLVQAYRTYPSSNSDPDRFFYFYSKAFDFFEVAFVFNDTGVKNWQPLPNNAGSINLTLPSPYTMKMMRDSSAYYAVYMRVKGCTTEHKLSNITLRANIISYVYQTVTGCDTVNLNFQPYSDYNSTFCYPYQWRLLQYDEGTGDYSTIIYDWDEMLYNRSTKTLKDVPVGRLKLEFRDSEGYAWSYTTTTSIPKPYLTSSSPMSYAYKEPDGLYRSIIYPYFSNSNFPVGTTFKFLGGPTPPPNLTGTVTSATNSIYPYPTNYTTRVEPGTYEFEVTKPGCTPDTLSRQHYVYRLESPPVYTLTEECDGLLLTFTGGGQLQQETYNGTKYNYGTPHVRIASGSSGGDLSKTVTHGGSLKLPLAGRYIINLLQSASSSTVVHRDTIDYSPTPFTLDHVVTSAYLCQGEATGFIRVQGKGAQGGYKYELYDNDVLKFTNTTGVFSYGVGGGTYKVVLYDTICGYSYPQELTLIDLGIAQIAYSSSSDNNFCTSDSIYLKCLTLGETTYTWSGPGIDAVDATSPAYKNKQNPAIAAHDVGTGTHTYTIRVTPESCGIEMEQTVVVTVEDCEGARDDYLTMLKNTTDSVDVLPNDGYPLSCSASVVPIVIAGPTHGTASIVNKKVVYTPDLNFLGKDSLTYSATCGGTTTTAKVYFNVMSYPDNIVDSTECVISFEPIIFDVKRQWHSAAATAHGQTGLLVGDLDGDGISEIVTTASSLSALNVLDGSTGALKYTVTIPNNSAYATGGWLAVLTGVLVDSDGNGKGELIFASNDNQLTSYEAVLTGSVFSLVTKWQTTFVSPATGSSDNKPQPIVADFNGDGIPEVVVFHQIFNAQNGHLLGQTENVSTAYVGRITNRGGNNKTNFMTAIDFDGDGLPEIAAGGKIYKVTIDPTGTAATCSILYQTTAFGDGFTSVADVDLDGNMDVVVVDYSSSLTRINVWSPKDNRVIDQLHIPNSDMYQGYAFIGDIDGVVSADGKRYPEICVTTRRLSSGTQGRVSAYKYNPATQRYDHKWDLINTDTSGGTGITLFDFNNDGINELVYRDEQYLYILNGVADGTAPVLASVNSRIVCASGTSFEYPVIADTDGSGSAKICITCSGNGTAASHSVNVFESATTPWAPTRRVWNQVNYEPTGINDDLTVPVYLFPKNYTFQIGTDKFRPFNGTLIQTPITDSSLNPVVNAADPYVADISSTFPNDTTIRVSVVIGNQGAMNTNASLPVAFYIESIAGANLFDVRPIGIALTPGNTTTLYYDIPTHTVQNRVYVRIQDNGTTYPASGSYTDCDYSNNTLSGITVIAMDDHIFVKKGDNALISVLHNDFPGSCNTLSVALTIETAPVHGTATVNTENKLEYTPALNFEGNDSIKYKITCGGASDEAIVYIQVKEFPDNIIEKTCYTLPPVMQWSLSESYTGGNYSVLQQPLVGDIDGDGRAEIFVTNNSTVESGDRIHILNSDGTEKHSFQTPTAFNGQIPLSAVGRVKMSGGAYQGIIITFSPSTGLLIAYDDQGTKLWQSSERVSSTTLNDAMVVSLVDLDGDGWAEVCAGDKVFAAESGILLCKGAGINVGRCKGFSAAYYLVQSAPASIYNNGRMQICIGTSIYEVNIVSRTNAALNSFTLVQSVAPRLHDGTIIPSTDGTTAVIDLDLDGFLDVQVSWIDTSNKDLYVYVWSPFKQEVIASKKIPNMMKKGPTFMGDIDGDGYPEIIFNHGVLSAVTSHADDGITALKLDLSDTSTGEFSTFWKITHSDKSCGTGLTLFDFNQDGIFEIIYRDEKYLRIINGSGVSHITGNDTISLGGAPVVYDLTTRGCGSTTAFEYPVVVDIDNDEQAEILTIGPLNSSYSVSGPLRIFKTGDARSPWAPARKVWNQFIYNPVYVNEDLTIPQQPISPATVFPGDDGILGTSDDIRPYNNVLQQQTKLNVNGTPIWLTPDVYPDPTLTSTVVTGDSVCIRVGIVNQGDAALGPPVYAALYKETVSLANFLLYDSANIQIMHGDTAYVDIRIPDMNLLPPVQNIVIRVNDNGEKFMYQNGCDGTNNVTIIRNPALHLLMKKNAILTIQPSLATLAHNGTYPNPVAMLNGEEIEYTITGVNTSPSETQLVIRDTIPAYLHYVPGSATKGSGIDVDSSFNVAVSNMTHDILKWTIAGVPQDDSRSVSFKATPREGVGSSQPKFVNRAWVTVDNDLHVPTNYTYHQGVGVSFVTFSASIGGTLYHATEQALDYMTSPRSGVLIVPDEGYRFAGWSHDEYVSFRGEKVAAASGIVLYDTLTIYGNVSLQANFELEKYKIAYRLNGAVNAATNPAVYTIESGAIELQAPKKDHDVFVGWTGSNGATPQASVVIPTGTTGDLEYNANFLHSGREEEDPLTKATGEDRIWSVKDELYIRVSEAGGIVHIYSTDGVLQRTHRITTAGETKIRLPRGLYVVTLNNHIGKKVMIE
jgi:uncharacterized repeat protein (TIGR02543 family)/uncharacterized repeat protein (TIGR01451 family)